MTDRFSHIRIEGDHFTGLEARYHNFGEPYQFSASFPLFLIREAWEAGCDFEEDADGFGPGLGTHGDWSGIRDSSDEAKRVMFEKALNFFFRQKRL